jgi:hypothetical protein
VKTALKILAALLTCALVGAGGFYLGHSFTLAMALREGMATDAVQRVEILRRFRSDIPENPRKIFETELAYMTFNLDSALNSKWATFLDRRALLYARDNALVYFHVFRPASLADASAGVTAQFAADPREREFGLSRLLQPHHDRNVATDRRLDQLLSEFDPAKLDSNNRRFHESLTAEQKKP